MSEQRSIGRREFVTRASVAGAAGLTGIAGLSGEAFAARKPTKKSTKKVASKGHSLSDFANRVGSKFVMTKSQRMATEVPNKQVTLVLESATAKPLQKGDARLKLKKTTWVNGGNRLRMEPFTLMFAAPGAEKLEQGTYVVAHKDFKKFYVFLVHMPFKPDGTRYEEPHYVACFN